MSPPPHQWPILSQEKHWTHVQGSQEMNRGVDINSPLAVVSMGHAAQPDASYALTKTLIFLFN